jgi:cold shock CspA family protein
LQVPVQVVLKNVPRPAAVRAEVLKAAEVLERFHPRITSCRVAVTNPDSRHASGGLFDGHIVLQMPGRPDVVVSRRAGDRPEREHLGVALRKAFATVRRQLQDSVRRLRGDVKLHAAADMAKVAKLFARDGYGFLETAEGREIYFHRNSVTGDAFGDLKIGMHVRFVESVGENGAQASTVTPVETTRVARALKAKRIAGPPRKPRVPRKIRWRS